jgi:hypothetical protein
MLNQPFGLHYPATRVRPGMPWSARLLLSVALIGAGWVAFVAGALWKAGVL